MTFAGIFLAGVSVAIFKASDFGTDPNSCFVMGVWNLAGIKYSYVYIAINALMLNCPRRSAARFGWDMGNLQYRGRGWWDLALWKLLRLRGS